MKVGIIVPQGWTGEYAGWHPAHAWRRSVFVASLAERLGFESLWAYDHFHTTPQTTDELTFESFTTLTALASVTHRVRLGHVVTCAQYRNPALTAKMLSTLDVVSAGRVEFGIGAGWKKDEFEAYGYEFPAISHRLRLLEESLEVISRMFSDAGRSTFTGTYLSIKGAVNLPKPLQQPRIPIMVGGNGPNVTWRLAARFADELNLDSLDPAAVRRSLPVIRQRCEEIGRDPDTLPVSVHWWWNASSEEGAARVDRLGEYKACGVSRLQTLVRRSVETDEALISLAEDCRRAGVSMEGAERA